MSMRPFVYDVCIVGAGPAGCMAAVQAGIRGKHTLMLERNEKIGKKILLTGGGKCNVTNTADIDAFIAAFGKQGHFYRQAFNSCSNKDVIEYFSSRGVAMIVDDSGRVLPKDGDASTVVNVLKDTLFRSNVTLRFNSRVEGITKEQDMFKITTEDNHTHISKKLILATGGASYAATGSTGDGFRIAKQFGHDIVDLRPALVPVRIKEIWPKKLQGLSLQNVRLMIKLDSLRIASEAGEVVFTHFGISGPLVLDISNRISHELKNYKELPLTLDLMPQLSLPGLERALQETFSAHKNVQVKNCMAGMFAQRLVVALLKEAGVDPGKKVNQVSAKERLVISKVIKSMSMTIVGTLPLDAAMVTGGGVSMREIDPRTMESRLVPGLYFAGEIIDGCGLSGGFNLQQAFSTGNLAGRNAADSCVTLS